VRNVLSTQKPCGRWCGTQGEALDFPGGNVRTEVRIETTDFQSILIGQLQTNGREAARITGTISRASTLSRVMTANCIPVRAEAALIAPVATAGLRKETALGKRPISKQHNRRRRCGEAASWRHQEMKSVPSEM
jgi:hypothetical protein